MFLFLPFFPPFFRLRSRLLFFPYPTAHLSLQGRSVLFSKLGFIEDCVGRYGWEREEMDVVAIERGIEEASGFRGDGSHEVYLPFPEFWKLMKFGSFSGKRNDQFWLDFIR